MSHSMTEFKFSLEECDGAAAKWGPTLSSETFEALGVSWMLHVYPKGVTEHPEPYVSIFLKLADAECIPSTELPHAKIELMIVNRAQHLNSVTKTCKHSFTVEEDDWGFQRFIRCSKLWAARQQFMPDGDLLVRVRVTPARADADGSERVPPAQATAARDCASQASAAAPQSHAAVEEAQAGMRAAQAAGEAAQREVAVQAAKYQVAQARLEVLQAEMKWRAAQAVLDSTMAGEDVDGEDNVDGKDDVDRI